MFRVVVVTVAWIALTGCGAREPFLRPEFAKIVDSLGKAGKFQGGGPCDDADKLAKTFEQEIGQKPLSKGAPKFALAASKICPAARPVFYTETQPEFATIAPLIGAQPFDGDGHMQLEPWLWLRVSGGKVIGLEFLLAQI